jgi:hypothetical protein
LSVPSYFDAPDYNVQKEVKKQIQQELSTIMRSEIANLSTKIDSMQDVIRESTDAILREVHTGQFHPAPESKPSPIPVSTPAPRTTPQNRSIVTTTFFHEQSLARLRVHFHNESALMHWSGLMPWLRNEFHSFKQHFDLDLVNETNAFKIWNDTSRIFVEDADFCAATLHFKAAGSVKRHILFTRINENWGGLSTYIPNRTINWGNLEGIWRNQGCTKEDVLAYLNHENTTAAFTTQHQAFDHPKVHSIPLGIKDPSQLLEDLRRNSTVNKTQLLMVNSNLNNVFRYHVNDVLEKFNGTVQNTYGYKHIRLFYDEIRRSKFVLCPGGMGWDTYRAWEVLSLGGFPIIERYNRTDGWHRTFDGLPVLWVEHYDDLTTELLEKEYLRLATRHPDSYNYEKLTTKWWIDFVNSFRDDDMLQVAR